MATVLYKRRIWRSIHGIVQCVGTEKGDMRKQLQKFEFIS